MLHQALFFLLLFFLPTQLGKHFWPDFAFVLGRRIDYLSPAIFLTDVLIAGVLISWAWEKPGKGNWRFSKKQIIISASLLFLLFLNIVFSHNYFVAMTKAIKIAELLLLGLYIVDAKPRFHSIILPLSLSAIYSGTIAIFQFILQRSVGGVLWIFGERLFSSATHGIAQSSLDGRLVLRPYATFPHPNVLAGYLVMLFPLFFFAKARSKLERYVYTAAMIVSLITLSLAMSRLAWLVFMLVFIAILPIRLRRALYSKQLLTVCSTLFTIIAVLGSWFVFRISELFTDATSIAERAVLINASLALFFKKPLLGVGLNNFLTLLPQTIDLSEIQYSIQPVHSIYFLMLSEAGLIGFCSFVLLIGLALFQTVAKKRISLFFSLSALALLGLGDHYIITLQQTQLLAMILLALSFV